MCFIFNLKKNSFFATTILILIQGTLKERGIIAWNAQNHVDEDEVDVVGDVEADEEMTVGTKQEKCKPGLEVYDFPFGMEFLKR